MNHPKNMNHVHRNSKYFVPVIITMGKNISVGYTVFYDKVKHKDLANRPHLLKRLHGRIIMGPFEIYVHGGYLWILHRASISFILAKKQLCISFVMGIGFITNI